MQLKINEIRNTSNQSNFLNSPEPPLFYQTIYEVNKHHGVKIENLKKLAIFSETIEEPQVIGKFNNEQHYLKTLELVLKSTQETNNRISFFLRKILSILPIKDSVIDIGPGDGSLTRALANYFKEMTIIDKNKYILNRLILPKSLHFKKINKSILDVKLVSNSHNLAVLSHILYYIDSKDRLDIIKSVYKSVKKNGVLVIVLGGDELGKADLIKNFGGHALWIDSLALDCLNEFGSNNVHLYASEESFITYTKKAMHHISSFMLGDANITANKSELNDYIEQNFQQSDNYFEMTTKQKYIVIAK